MLIPFSAAAKTLNISATAAASTSIALPSCGSSVRIVNEGPNIAFVSIGAGTQTATLPASSSPVATCTPVMVGDCVLGIVDTGLAVSGAGTPLNISAICRAGQTAALSIQVAEGV